MHGTKDGKDGVEIVVVIAQGVADRFGDDDLSGELHDADDLLAGEQGNPEVRDPHVADHDFGTRVDGFGMARREIVQDDDRIAGIAELLHGMGTDVSGSARHENLTFFHGNIPPIFPLGLFSPSFLTSKIIVEVVGRRNFLSFLLSIGDRLPPSDLSNPPTGRGKTGRGHRRRR